MSVFVWINSEREISSLLPWSRWLASELGQPLILLCYGGAYGAPHITEVDKSVIVEDLLLQVCCEAAFSGKRYCDYVVKNV